MRNWIAAALLAATAGGDIRAQSPWSLSVGGGGSFPTGQFARGADVGWHGLASIGLSSIMQPMSLRLDASYGRFGSSSADQAISSGTLNLAYRLPSSPG